MHHTQLPLLTVLPFVALLLVIALAPLVLPRWWHHNTNKALVVFLISIPVLVYLGRTEIGRLLLLEKAHEYIGFIVVIGALFMITGGIHIEGSLAGTPLVNTAMLAIGAVLSNLLGTTGASVLLIRPLLRANQRRKRVAHIVVFFIFIVANCGGLLTPIGDPPLLLGFLKGVPFTWTLRLWPQWLALNGILLVLFNIWDRWANRDEVEVPSHEPLRVRGAIELAALAGVMATIITGGSPLVILIFALLAYFLGSEERRTLNVFTFVPLVEVAVLFAAIFITMTPVLEILNARATDLGLTTPRQFFWASGTLSSVLDNAPTYLAFAASAAGLQGIPPHGPYIGALALDPQAAKLLAAISTGSVFMGANTYIGNAPNFMVKAIAEGSGVRMPSFFGYMAYSLGLLVPLFVLVSVVFFR
ncbi:MAG TPA: sodium:proton antiporter [Gemmatimonadales bacterium]|nr:sodium:proton antiporter [Gemmatimonadales bacterium]